jgi:hypothetical protein
MICQVVKIKINRKDKMTKRLTLNAEKRKAIESVFQSHWIEHSKFNQGLQEAKEKYNQMRVKMLSLVSNVVRHHQPQEDVDTIRAMSNKYGSSGGELYHDNCFNFETDIINDEGERDKDTVRVDFSLDDNHGFARAYYRDELIKANCDPDFQVRWNEDNKRNPKYYEEENKCDTWLGFRNSSNEDKSIIKPKAEWERDKIWVIGTSYCHTRQFKVDETTFKIFKEFNKLIGNVAVQHQQLFSTVEEKMKKLRLGLKSYRYFDQAKALADKLGIALNESILNESSSMALSVYSPENLASLLEDKVEQTREEKIAIAKRLLQEQASIN